MSNFNEIEAAEICGIIHWSKLMSVIWINRCLLPIFVWWVMELQIILHLERLFMPKLMPDISYKFVRKIQKF